MKKNYAVWETHRVEKIIVNLFSYFQFFFSQLGPKNKINFEKNMWYQMIYYKYCYVFLEEYYYVKMLINNVPKKVLIKYVINNIFN